MGILSRDIRKKSCLHVRPGKIQVSLPIYAVIRIFTGHILDSQECKDSSVVDNEDWSDCANMQADLSVHWVHMSECPLSHVTQMIPVSMVNVLSWPRWLIWMCRPTGDQEVTGSALAEVGNILLWRLIMKYFLRSFSPFRFKKGSCQFLAKECAQYWLTAWRTKPAQ